MYPECSVVMSIYRGDDPIHFRQGIQSLLSQSMTPSEIVLVVDGPIDGELAGVISEFEQRPFVKVLRLPSNVGRGAARHHAILATTHDLVAVMDADDVSIDRRLECQMKMLVNQGVDVVGGYIGEFDGDAHAVKRVRTVPLTHARIVARGRWHQPFNHVTIMFRKEAYLRAGGYRSFRRIEDYDLFHRMVNAGVTFANHPDVLVLVRTSHDQYRRRQGLEYFLEECRLYREMLGSGYINWAEFSWNISIRVVARFMPATLLRAVSTALLRSKVA